MYICKDKNSGPATGTRGIAVTASALEKPGICADRF